MFLDVRVGQPNKSCFFVAAEKKREGWRREATATETPKEEKENGNDVNHQEKEGGRRREGKGGERGREK